MPETRTLVGEKTVIKNGKRVKVKVYKKKKLSVGDAYEAMKAKLEGRA